MDSSSSEEVGECGERKGTPMIMQQEDVWNPGTRDSTLQILANLVYNRYEYQEKMRKEGGIELVLNHTKIHPKHPLQREWALFTVRNLCAANEENQKYIDGFKVEGIASEPALEKLGVKVEMKDGKVNIKRLYVCYPMSFCPVCDELFGDKDIFSIGCGHVFCNDCLSKLLETTRIKECPICKRQLYESEIRKIYISGISEDSGNFEYLY